MLFVFFILILSFRISHSLIGFPCVFRIILERAPSLAPSFNIDQFVGKAKPPPYTWFAVPSFPCFLVRQRREPELKQQALCIGSTRAKELYP